MAGKIICHSATAATCPTTRRRRNVRRPQTLIATLGCGLWNPKYAKAVRGFHSLEMT
jgi:hypothetical protein